MKWPLDITIPVDPRQVVYCKSMDAATGYVELGMYSHAADKLQIAYDACPVSKVRIREILFDEIISQRTLAKKHEDRCKGVRTPEG